MGTNSGPTKGENIYHVPQKNKNLLYSHIDLQISVLLFLWGAYIKYDIVIFPVYDILTIIHPFISAGRGRRNKKAQKRAGAKSSAHAIL
jgi:hypothetical protein